MQRLIAELRRLFLLPDAPPSSDAPTADGESRDAPLRRQLAGGEPAAPPLQGAQGRTRLMVLGLHGVPQGRGAAHCSAVLQLGRTLMEELDLPEPALSVNGREGFELWLSLAQPLPADEAAGFLALLQEACLPGLTAVKRWPPATPAAQDGPAWPVLPPALHPATGLWSVFVTPGLAASFTEEAGIDVPPNPDKQAELLARLAPIAPDALARAREALLLRLGRDGQAAAPATAPAPVPEAQPAAGPSVLPAPVAGGGPVEGMLPGALAGLRAALFAALAAPPAAVDTPFPGLSRLLHGGFRAGRLYALLAPPKSGKTTLAAACLDHAAAGGHPALYVGYEMARDQLVHAALARRLGLDAARIEGGTLTADEAGRVARALDAYLAREGRHLEIREARPGTGLADIAAWARAAAAERPGRTPLVVIDPLPLAADIPPGAPDRAAALAAACKDLARSTGAAVIALGTPCRPPERESDLSADPEARALLGAADGVLVLQARPPALQEAEAADGAHGSAGPARVRLQLLAHRGRIGELALLHWRAWHRIEEAGAPPRRSPSPGEDGRIEALPRPEGDFAS